MAKILIAEDDEDLARLLTRDLTAERHIVDAVHNGTDALALAKTADFDVIVLDWMLPGLTGVEVAKQFRETGGQTPILMLTGRAAIGDKQVGFDSGADDYLTKPFDIRELLARVSALLRRQRLVGVSSLDYGDIMLDPSRHRVTKGGAEIHLLPRDFALLEFLMRHPGEIFSSDSLLNRVWHYDSEASNDGLRAAIRRIRKAIDDGDDVNTSIIENVPRVGYRLRQR